MQSAVGVLLYYILCCGLCVHVRVHMCVRERKRESGTMNRDRQRLSALSLRWSFITSKIQKWQLSTLPSLKWLAWEDDRICIHIGTKDSAYKCSHSQPLYFVVSQSGLESWRDGSLRRGMYVCHTRCTISHPVRQLNGCIVSMLFTPYHGTILGQYTLEAIPTCMSDKHMMARAGIWKPGHSNTQHTHRETLGTQRNPTPSMFTPN